MLKDSQVKKLSKSEAKEILRNSVYSSTMILERLEEAGKIDSISGYELRQSIVEFSLSLLDKNWVKHE
jgi:hypothetical protein